MEQWTLQVPHAAVDVHPERARVRHARRGARVPGRASGGLLHEPERAGRRRGAGLQAGGAAARGGVRGEVQKSADQGRGMISSFPLSWLAFSSWFVERALVLGVVVAGEGGEASGRAARRDARDAVIAILRRASRIVRYEYTCEYLHHD